MYRVLSLGLTSNFCRPLKHFYILRPTRLPATTSRVTIKMDMPFSIFMLDTRHGPAFRVTPVLKPVTFYFDTKFVVFTHLLLVSCQKPCFHHVFDLQSVLRVWTICCRLTTAFHSKRGFEQCQCSAGMAILIHAVGFFNVLSLTLIVRNLLIHVVVKALMCLWLVLVHCFCASVNHYQEMKHLLYPFRHSSLTQ